MTMLVVVLLVGAGSYALRLAPLLLMERIRLTDRRREMLGHAATAAMTALLVSLALHAGASAPAGAPAAAPWVALGAGGAAALLRQSMARVALAGMLAYAVTVLVAAL